MVSTTKLLFSICAAFFFTQISYSQVTIGSSATPVSGSLLDLRQYDDNQAKEGGRNAIKGLGMPRVNIVAPAQLELENYIGQSLDKDVHLGLLIYNVKQKDGADITQREEMICPGLHVWDGTNWLPLVDYPQTGLTCIEINLLPATITGISPLHFASGLDERGTAIANQNVNLTWTPATAGVTMVKSSVSIRGEVLDQIVFTAEPASDITTGTGSDLYSLAVESMTPADIASNLFRTKAVRLNFTVTGDNVEPATFISTIYQTNFVLTAYGSQENKVIRRIQNGNVEAIPISGNVKWNAVLSDNTQSSISTLSGGVYTNTNAATYNSSLLMTQSRKQNIIPKDLAFKFTDTTSPNIWKDVTVSLSECRGGAIDYVNDKADVADVKVVTDQNGNKYWARDFGDAGTWMLQNLRATTYDNLRKSDFANGGEINGWIEDLTNPTYGPNTGDSPDENKYVRAYNLTSEIEMTEEEFENNSEYGLFYDFKAAHALARNNSATIGYLSGDEHVQGMCPYGWRVATTPDYIKLMHEINNNTPMYSTVAEPLNVPLLLRGVDYQGTSPGVTFFKPEATAEQQSALIAAMIDVCDMDEAGVANMTHSSPKFMGGISLLFTGHIRQGSLVSGGKRIVPWTICGLEGNYDELDMDHLSFNIINANSILKMTSPTNNIMSTYMKPVRCMHD